VLIRKEESSNHGFRIGDRMATELIINASLPETRISLMENGEIQELLIERASGKGIVGNIYKGRVTRVLPGMQAAFVDIGLEKAAFLYVDDVYVHSEIWEEEESTGPNPIAAIQEAEGGVEGAGESQSVGVTAPIVSTTVEAKKSVVEGGLDAQQNLPTSGIESMVKHPRVVAVGESTEEVTEELMDLVDSSEDEESFMSDQDDAVLVEEDDEGEDEDEDENESDEPVGMGPGPEGGNNGDDSTPPEGTIAPPVIEVSSQERREEATFEGSSSESFEESSEEGSEEGSEEDASEPNTSGNAAENVAENVAENEKGGRRRHRRGRRGGRFRNRRGSEGTEQQEGSASNSSQVGQALPETFNQQVEDHGGNWDSDRSILADAQGNGEGEGASVERPSLPVEAGSAERRQAKIHPNDFNSQRNRDRRIRPRTTTRSVRAQVNIQDLLKEGQEVLVQVAKDPIATKGARLTCHISLPGRHLVCMPTIDHVGVSRRIERDDERRKLRDFVERNRPKNLGFIVRTASGRGQSEKRIKQDIDYLTRLWTEIREKTANVTAPALVYEDLNAVLRAIRDWVTEDINKIIVDSRYHYNEILRFVSHFMPAIRQKVDLYHGDIPIFDAYNISTELSRALERKVWLKSGGYIVIDQAEALVAIDVNTGRYVGKKNLEDTILKTNLEAVQEIAYQLRLRNCGGIIILDLIDMEKEENKQRVYRALEEALKKDRARPTILKISELGLIEMTRKRTRDTIVRSLCESCSHCEGKGFIKSKQTVAYEVLREIEREGIEQDVSKILVHAHSDVIDLLAIDERETLDQLERRYRKQIYLQAVTDFHPEQFEVMGDKKVKSERSAGYLPSKTQGDVTSRDRESGTGDRGDRNRGRDRDRGRGRDRNRDRNRDRGGNTQGTQAVIEPVVRDVVVSPAVHAEIQSDMPVGILSDQVIPSSEMPIETPSITGQLTLQPVDMPRSSDDQFEEEDRLAFLRAQAAQDAALARLRNASEPMLRSQANAGSQQKRGTYSNNATSNTHGALNNRDTGGGSRGGGGRNSNNRRRRGGKFRGGQKNFQGNAPSSVSVEVQGGGQDQSYVAPEGSDRGDSGGPVDSGSTAN